MSRSSTLLKIYYLLLKEYGEQHWWPAETPFEVMLGAILTQNTAWTNVEKAITGLKKACDLTPEGILSLAPEQLEEAIQSSGYFRQKAERVHGFCLYLVKTGEGDISRMEDIPTSKLREELLALKGIGPETADSILLYALSRSVFVVDAYTRRLLSRLGMCPETAKYEDLQAQFMDNLDPDAEMFNEYHALIVRHAKERCRKREPECEECALRKLCKFYLRSEISNLR